MNLRIGISGSACVGKTTLARALSEKLKFPCIDEEMRAYIEKTRTPLGQLPAEKVSEVLSELWRNRAARERSLSAFVADNSCLDFTAYALFYDCLADPVEDDLLFKEPKVHLSCYDAIFILPWGELPYVADGIRSPKHSGQLRYQMIIEGLLKRYADPQKIHFIPLACRTLKDRVDWIVTRLETISPALSAIVSPPPSTSGRGFVYLVGAGPGDAGLLTQRAVELLKSADVVAYDELVSPAVLSYANAGAEWLPVGRRSHGALQIPYKLHPAVLERARAGKRVVRLKGGDPHIFGRGGEEAEELLEAGIHFEIVPGVSAANGASAFTGIPLTHRRLASDVTFATGHDPDGGRQSHTNWSALAAGKGTLVLYMAARNLASNLARLVDNGRPSTTPAAFIASATLPQQKVIVGTLADLAEKTRGLPSGEPALVIVGDVVTLRERLAWFERRPLYRQKILVARARPGPSEIAAQLQALGAEVMEAPRIEVVEREEAASLGETLSGENTYEAVVFGCVPGVEIALRYADASVLARRPLVALGKPVGDKLVSAGLAPAIRLEGACRDVLKGHPLLKGRLLVITSEDGRPSLIEDLSRVGATAEVLPLYRHIKYFPDGAGFAPRLVVLPSSSAARNILGDAAWPGLRDVPAVAMGPKTEEAARSCGAKTVYRSAEDNISSLINAVVKISADAGHS